MSKFKDRRVHFRKSGMKVLNLDMKLFYVLPCLGVHICHTSSKVPFHCGEATLP